jgi:hypothetical protein
VVITCVDVDNGLAWLQFSIVPNQANY